MNDIVAELISELKTLRKGRGIGDRDVRHRAGPALRDALDVSTDATGSDIRAAAKDWLTALAGQLPEDLRLAVLVAFGVHPDAPSRFYTERVAWLAGQIHRDERTAQRRIDEASAQLADLAVTAARKHRDPDCPVGTTPWHTESLTAYVVLDGPVPEIIESRRIVSNGDGLTVVDLAVTLPTPPVGEVVGGALGVDVLSGGTMVRTAMESSRRIGFAVELPAPLGRDRRTELTVRFRVLDTALFQPYYVCLPRHRCDHLDLRVRFGRDRLPRQVWRVAGVFQSDIDDPNGTGDPIGPDDAGELAVTFDDLTPGFGYGARWSP